MFLGIMKILFVNKLLISQEWIRTLNRCNEIALLKHDTKAQHLDTIKLGQSLLDCDGLYLRLINYYFVIR